MQRGAEEPRYVRFFTGGIASCTAETATLPIDIVKKGRAQSIFSTVGQIVRNEGFLSLWKGFGPAMLRQMSYSGLRMGLYEPIRILVSGCAEEGNVSPWHRFVSGGLAGGIGIFIANPTDLLKTRFQADKAGTRYQSMTQAFRHIVKHEGIRALWIGCVPAVSRAVVVNAAELGTYDEAKHLMVASGYFNADASSTHFLASALAGFMSSVCCSPIDVIKNRIMSQDALKKTSEVVYRGVVDCAVKTVRSEGFFALYKGFFPLWLRLSPWNIVFFMTYERYNHWCRPLWQRSGGDR